MSIATAAYGLVLVTAIATTNAMGAADLAPVDREITEAHVLGLIDNQRPELREVVAARDRGDIEQARALLVQHFADRTVPVLPAPRFPGISASNSMLVLQGSGALRDKADNFWLKHRFHLSNNDVGRIETHQLPDPIRWIENPSEGFSWGLYLNQLNVVSGLAGVYRDTKEPKYAVEAGRMVLTWTQQMPRGFGYVRDGQVIASGMEVRNRLCNVLAAYDVLRRCPELTREMHMAFWKLFVASSRELIEYDGVSYPGLIASAVLLPEFTESSRWFAEGKADLEKHLFARTTPEGAWDTHSISYQTVPVPWAMRGLELLRANSAGDPDLKAFADRIEPQLAKMLAIMLRLTMPNGGLPNIGDTYGRSDWNAGMTQRSYDAYAALCLTEAQRHELEKLPPITRNVKALRLGEGHAAPNPSMAMPGTGYYVMRNGFEPDWATYVYFDLSPQAIGHSHNDAGHFEFYADGKPLITDTGDYFLGWGYLTCLHNTIEIDGKHQPRADNAVMLPCDWLTTPAVDLVEGAYTALDRTGATHRRKLVFVKPDYVVLCDLLTGNGEHTAEQFFHFAGPTVDTGATVDIDANAGMVATNHQGVANVSIHDLLADGATLTLAEAKDTDMDPKDKFERDAMLGWIVTTGTFQRVKSAVAVYSRRAELPMTFAQLLVASPARGHADVRPVRLDVREQGQSVPATEALAFETVIDLTRPTHGAEQLQPNLGVNLASGAQASASINTGDFSAATWTNLTDGDTSAERIAGAVGSAPYNPDTPLEGAFEITLDEPAAANTVVLHHGTFNGTSILYTPDETRLQYHEDGAWRDVRLIDRTVLPEQAERLRFETVRSARWRAQVKREAGGRLSMREFSIHHVPDADYERIEHLATERTTDTRRDIVCLSHTGPGLRTYGPIETDAEAVLLRHDGAGTMVRLFVRNGSFVKLDGREIIRLARPVPWLCADWADNKLTISSPIRCGLRIASQRSTAASWNDQTLAGQPVNDLFVIADTSDQAPTIGDLICAAYPRQRHMAGGQPYAVLTCTTDRPTLLDVTFTEPDGLRRRAITTDKPATEHRVRIDFLHPKVAYTFTVQATDAFGYTASEVVKPTVATDSPPD
jgi:hypothetical protein